MSRQNTREGWLVVSVKERNAEGRGYVLGEDQCWPLFTRWDLSHLLYPIGQDADNPLTDGGG